LGVGQVTVSRDDIDAADVSAGSGHPNVMVRLTPERALVTAAFNNLNAGRVRGGVDESGEGQ
jgi:hypothetical protein